MTGAFGIVQHGYTSNGTKHYMIYFRVGCDAKLTPPFTKGDKSMAWSTYKPDPNDKESMEKAIGWPILPYANGEENG